INVEWLFGFRWLKFTEDMRFAAFNSTPPYPPTTFYDLDVENNLLGTQMGARIDRCLSSCLSLSLGVKFGIYNNDIYARQSIRDGAGTYATASTGGFAGDDYVHASRKDDVAGLGELDLGLNYIVNNNWRVNVGYRAIGIAGVALAPTQIPRSFTDYNDVRRIKSNGDLMLHGAYFGLEWSF
ncbi:MAG: BBP7 family outer membrane beta-barrel protein, partial [Pirellulaceae bacterium]